MDFSAQIVEIVQGRGPTGIRTDEVCQTLDRTPQELGDSFESLKQDGLIQGFAGVWIASGCVAEMVDLWVARLEILHAQHPEQPLLPAVWVAENLDLNWGDKPADRFAKLLEDQRLVRYRKGRIALPDWVAEIKSNQRDLLDRVIAALDKGGLEPPTDREIAGLLHVPVQTVRAAIELGLDRGELAEIGPGLIYSQTVLTALAGSLHEAFSNNTFSVGQARDLFATSRRIIVPLLEQFDSMGMTELRDGMRVFRS